MKLIRNKVFETNSSSCHSISISNCGSLMDTIYLDRDTEIIQIGGGEFGWGYENHSDAETKLDYLLTYIRDHSPNKKEDYDMVEEVVLEQTGAKGIVHDFENNSYIDHQSCDVVAEAMVSKETIRDFIFNPNSTLTIDNDN